MKLMFNPTKYQNDALFKLEIRKIFELLNLGFIDVYRYINKNRIYILGLYVWILAEK